ncbi:Uncharacterised protein g5871 [Pycnogonum litorale]
MATIVYYVLIVILTYVFFFSRNVNAGMSLGYLNLNCTFSSGFCGWINQRWQNGWRLNTLDATGSYNIAVAPEGDVEAELQSDWIYNKPNKTICLYFQHETGNQLRQKSRSTLKVIMKTKDGNVKTLYDDQINKTATATRRVDVNLDFHNRKHLKIIFYGRSKSHWSRTVLYYIRLTNASCSKPGVTEGIDFMQKLNVPRWNQEMWKKLPNIEYP